MTAPLAHLHPPRTLMIGHTISTRRLVITVIVTLAIIVGSSAVAWNGDVPEWEADVLRFFNGWPDWLKPMMWALQQPGVILAPIFAGLVVVSFTRRWQHFVAFACILPLKLGIEKGLVKQLVQRERPYVSIGPEINVRGPAFEGLSFPSGHATTAFALGILLAAFLPPGGVQSRWCGRSSLLSHGCTTANTISSTSSPVRRWERCSQRSCGLCS